MSTPKFITHILTLTLTLVVSVLLIIPGLPVFSQTISIEPFEVDRTDPNERGWFVYNVEPGTVIEDFLVIRNDHPAATIVQLNANDGVSTPDGSFALAANDTENTGVGAWVELAETQFNVDGNTNLKVPFKIKVPSDIKSGEYAGGLSVVQISEEEQAGGPIGAKIRIGARIYLTVSGDVKQNTEVSNLMIVNPRMENFANEMNKRGYIAPDNMVVKFTAKELEQIYSRSTGEIIFELPDGTTQTRPFNRDLLPNAGTDEYYIQTKIPYQIGTTKVTMNFKNTQIVDSNKEGIVANANPEGTLTYTLEFTQADLDEFNRIREDLINRTTEEYNLSPTVAKETTSSAFSISEAEEEEKEETVEEAEDDNTLLIIGGIIIALIVVLIIVVVLKKKPAKTEEETSGKAKKDESSKE